MKVDGGKWKAEFVDAINAREAAFGLKLDDASIQHLADYYELVLEHNPLLHLVAPCSAEEFAVRHILESLTLLKHLSQGAKFADVGAGAGLPSIPCLIAREDLRAVLIESKEKKAAFLKTTIDALGLTMRAEVVNRQFEEVDLRHCKFVACRALDKFAEKLPRLIKWSGRRTLLFFGGPNLAETFSKHDFAVSSHLLPLSQQRFLFIRE